MFIIWQTQRANLQTSIQDRSGVRAEKTAPSNHKAVLQWATSHAMCKPCQGTIVLMPRDKACTAYASHVRVLQGWCQGAKHPKPYLVASWTLREASATAISRTCLCVKALASGMFPILPWLSCSSASCTVQKAPSARFKHASSTIYAMQTDLLTQCSRNAVCAVQTKVCASASALHQDFKHAD